MAAETDNAASSLPPPPDNPMGCTARGGLGAYLFFMIVLLVYLLGKFWPVDFTTTGVGKPQVEVLFGFVDVKASAESRRSRRSSPTSSRSGSRFRRSR